MNIYNRIKAATQIHTGIAQYFICCYQYQLVFNQQRLADAFSNLCNGVYPRLAKANGVSINTNSIRFVKSLHPALDAEKTISSHYLEQIEKANSAPVIATVYYHPEKPDAVLCYYFNHVFLDVSAAKILHLGLMQLYQQGQSAALDKAYCLGDDSFLQQALEKFNPKKGDYTRTIAKELVKASVRAGAWVKAKRLVFNKRTHGVEIQFQRFQFDKKAINPASGVSSMAHLSAVIAMAYMETFASKQCNFVVPVDLRQRSQRWLLGNPIAGVFIKMQMGKSLEQHSQAIQKGLEHYLNGPVLYWLYQLVMRRMALLSDKAVFKKAWRYSEKSHFISTHLGNITRVNSQFAEAEKASTTDAYAYSYPLQNSIAVSLAVTQFERQISINLSASDKAFTGQQQKQFAKRLEALLETQVSLLRPLE